MSRVAQGEWEAFIQQVEGLPPVQQRGVAAVLGALVADAASQPLHWIYDHAKMQEVLADNADPAFVPVSRNPFYILETGSQSPYGDELFVRLKSLVECNGYNQEKFDEEYYKKFCGPNTTYHKPKGSIPIQSNWQVVTMEDFAAKYPAKQKTGHPSSVDPDALISIFPLVGLYAGQADFIEKCKNALLALQKSDIAVSSSLLAVTILEKYILGTDKTASYTGVLQKVVSELKGSTNAIPMQADMAQCVEEVLQSDLSISATEATKKFGMA